MPENLTPPFILLTSVRKMVLLLLGSLLFVAGGFLVAEKEPWTGYACVAFFGLCAIVGAVNLHPRSSYLEVTKDGFAFVSLFRRAFVPWEHVSEFVPIRMQRNQLVGWNYSSKFTGHSLSRKVSTALADVEGALPDTYGLPAADLAALLNTIRAARVT